MSLNDELHQYLLPSVSEWIIKNIIQQETVLAEIIADFLNNERILYLTPDCNVLYTYNSTTYSIWKYDLLNREPRIGQILPSQMLFQSMQHPYLVGFSSNEKKLHLLDITTNKIIFTWKLNTDAISEKNFYTWDEKTNLLINTNPDIINLDDAEELNFQEFAKLKLSNNKRQQYLFIKFKCNFLSLLEKNVTNESINIVSQFDASFSPEYIFSYVNNMLHKFRKFHGNHEDVYTCQHIIIHTYEKSIENYFVYNNLIVMNSKSTTTVFQYVVNSGLYCNKKCKCKI